MHCPACEGCVGYEPDDIPDPEPGACDETALHRFCRRHAYFEDEEDFI